MTKIAKYDPDVLMGHDMFGFDFDVLLHRFAPRHLVVVCMTMVRIKANNVPHWSRIGRMRRSVMPKLQVGVCQLYVSF